MAQYAWRQAGPLIRRGAWAEARPFIRRAFEAWPAQPAYASTYVALSARVQDTSETVRALSLLADMGFSVDIAARVEFAALNDAPALHAVTRRLAANAEPVVGSALAVTLSEADFFPEGMSHDPVSGVWYLGSVRHRKVSRVRRDGTAEDVVREGQDGLWAVLGVRADPATGTLWVTTAALPQMAGYVPSDSGRSGIYAFDLITGGLKARYLLAPSASGHLLGDLVVAPNGDVYATDSQDPAIYRIAKGGDRAEEFLRHPLFSSLQGPAVDPTGRMLYVADYSHGVMAIDLDTRLVRALAVPPGATVLGIDGLVWYGGSLIGVQNGVTPARVVRLVLDAAGGRIIEVRVLDRQPALAPEPTIGTVWAGRFYYVANSQWEEYDDAGRPKPGVRLEPPRILELRLP